MRGFVTKKGLKYYVVVELDKVDGKRNRKWFSGYDRKKDAEKALIQILNDLENNTLVLPSKVTVKEFFNYYIENTCKDLSPTTIRGYKTIINAHFIPAFGDKELQKLNPIDIDNYFNNKDLSGKTLTQHFRLLNKALNKAKTLQIIKSNPAENIDRPKISKFKAQVYSIDEIKLLFDKLQNHYLELPVYFAIFLGLRRGEIFGLQWQDINLKEKKLHVQNNLVVVNGELILKEPKSDTSNRILHLPDVIIDMLKKQKKKQSNNQLLLGPEYEKNHYVITKEDGRPYNPDTISSVWKKYLVDNDLKVIRFHDLRHTNATLMLQADVSMKVSSERLGHSNIGITMDLYSHVLEEMDIEVTDKLSSLFYQTSTTTKIK